MVQYRIQRYGRPSLGRIGLFAAITAIVFVMLPLAAGASETAIMYVAGELVLKMEPGHEVSEIGAQYGITVDQHLTLLDVYLVQAPGVANLDSLAQEIASGDEVEFCHPNFAVDPLQPVQGSLPISDLVGEGDYLRQQASLRLALASMPPIADGNGVQVATIDGGVDYLHPELESSVVSGYDYIDGDDDAYDEPGGPSSGHGTFVAGVLHLAAPGATIRAYRVVDTTGCGDGYVVAEAILQAIADGCRVVNLSLVTTAEHEAISRAADYAAQQNVLLVAAVGNGNADSTQYPASDPNILAVAAIDTLDVLADFSCFGEHVDVCAPGTDIYSSYVASAYAWWGGTSFAAPFVAGQAAMLWSLDPQATRADIVEAIQSSATSLDYVNPELAGLLGSGLISPLASTIALRGGAVVLHVPSVYSTIQEAVDAALPGDTVYVAAGDYLENVVISTSMLTLLSESGEELTFITGISTGLPVLTIESPSLNTKIEGFTIRGGVSARGVVVSGANASILRCDITGNGDGGIVCSGAGAAIRGCRLSKNGYPWSGAGVLARGDNTTIDSCIFFECDAEAGGGAIHGDQMEGLVVSKCVGYKNTTTTHGGGFIYVYDCLNASLIGNTMVDNTSIGRGAGITVYGLGPVDIRNNIVAFNNTTEGIWVNGDVLCEYNNVYGNAAGDYYGVTPGTGSISDAPLFLDTATADFGLLAASPCIDAGDPDPIYSDPDGSRNDLGAVWLQQRFPWVTNINFGPDSPGHIVTDSIPTIYWSFIDSIGATQVEYEIEVGTDNDWAVAEMWATGPTASSDSEAVYAGAVLAEGTSYFLRLRAGNGTDWSYWNEVSFATHYATVLHVPSVFLTIQSAVDVAIAGDTVLVAPGDYVENIALVLAGVTLLSDSGPDVTYVTGADYGVPVISIPTSASASTVNGFTIRDAQGARGIWVAQGADPLIEDCVITGNEGGGVFCEGDATVFRKCVMHNNGYPWSGAGVRVTGDDVIIDSCVFYECAAEAGGGAIHADGSVRLVVSKCLAYDNETTTHGGGFIYVYISDDVSLVGNTIVDNTSTGRGAGITAWGSQGLDIRNNIVASNNITDGIWAENSTVTSEYNDVFGSAGVDYNGVIEGVGSISEDPEFVGAVARYYALIPTSPCIAAADPDPVYNDPDGSRSDMGAPVWMVFESPWVGNINFGDPISEPMVVTDSIPTVYWTYIDTAVVAQSEYELEVGTDDDWSAAEMWATGAVASSDTQAVYAGAMLVDFASYYLRLRASNGTDWSSWSSLAFTTRLSSVLYVPSQFATIQDAMDVSKPGDSIVVASGIYPENITIDVPGVVLLSESGSDSTVIEGVTSGLPAVSITPNAGATVVSGFTIRDSQGARGIVLGSDSCTIYNCEIVNNEDGGIHCAANYSLMRQCIFHDNGEPWSGAGVWLRGDSTTIDSCTFYNCRSIAGGGAIHVDRVDGLTLSHSIGYENATGPHGGGFIYIYESPNVVLLNNTIVDNAADDRGSGVAIWTSGAVELRNNIVAYNTSAHGVWSYSTTVLNEYNDVVANLDLHGDTADYFGLAPGTGTVSEPPQFVDFFGNDFGLEYGSPCIDAGDPDPQYNDPDGSRNDVGALYAKTCCQGIAGDIDGTGDEADITDLIYLVTFMFQDGPEPPCMAETNINGAGSPHPDIADLIYLVGYMFQEGPEPAACQ